MAERGASGDFDYLREETDGSDGVVVDDEGNAYGSEPDLDYLLADGEPKAHDGFDAFDEDTWDEDFTPVSTTPWYRSSQARTLMIASATALSAIVVSLVLLVFRDFRRRRARTFESTTAVTTPLATATSESRRHLRPPRRRHRRRRNRPRWRSARGGPAAVRPRPTKEPEIGVTRTPATRQPISVAPQPRGPR